MTKISQRVLVVAGVGLVGLLPQAARADLAELSWSGRFGAGSIVYERNTFDAAPEDQHGSFLDNIRSFDLWGIKLPYGSGGIDLKGTSGSMLTLGKVTPCGFFQQCESSSVTFLLGRAHEGDPLHYKITFSLPFLLDGIDQLPLFDGGGFPLDEGQQVGASISNEFNSPSGSYYTAGFGASFTHRLLAVATPVPEPGTWALFGLGVGLLGFARRRR